MEDEAMNILKKSYDATYLSMRIDQLAPDDRTALAAIVEKAKPDRRIERRREYQLFGMTMTLNTEERKVDP
jgi:hypothetical protein